MIKILLFCTSLTALGASAQLPSLSKVLPAVTESYSLKSTPLPYAQLRHNTGAKSSITSEANAHDERLMARSSISAPNVAIHGYVAYSDNNSDGVPTHIKGMYRIDVNGFTNLNATDFTQNIDASYGGTIAGDNYWCAYVWDSQSPEIGQVPFLQQWNSNDWTLTDANFCDPNVLGWDWTYDPISKNIYGLFASGQRPILGIIDTANRTRTDIGILDRSFVSIAASDAGVLYAIDFEEGQLWTLNPTTAKSSYVGKTGIKTAYTASACYDVRSGKILWTPTFSDGSSALYAIDPSTAQSVKVMDFPAGEQVLGIYAVEPGAAPGLPAAPEELKVSFNGGKLSGEVSFTVPATNQDGSTSIGLKWNITVDNEIVASDSTSHGETLHIPLTVNTPGVHAFTVHLSNDVGNGPSQTVRQYIGFGIPKSPQPIVTREGNVNHLSWAAVTETTDGGYIDTTAITYKVVRRPGNVVLSENSSALMLDDEVEAENEYSYFYYELTAFNGGRTSQPGISNRLDSGHITPPYLQTFDTNESLKGFNILDCNEDKIMWVIDSKTAYLKYNSQIPADDWLISPPIVLESGKLYRISGDVKGKSSRYEERFSIWLGSDATVDGMTIPVVAETGVNSDTFMDYGAYISVPSTGLYFIGVHGTSEKNKYALIVDNLAVSAPTSLETPGAPTDITAIPSPDGSASATICIKAPTVNLGGNTLTEITKLKVNRGDSEVKVFENPQPGASLQFSDSAPEEGEYSYTAVAENSHGIGESITFKVYLGVNIPDKPSNITVTEPVPGTVSIAWNAPSTDADGHPINADLISYNLYRPNENGNMTPLVKDISETSYSYMARPTSVEQAFETYGVQAKTRRGVSPIIRSQLVPVGAPYTLPYIESYKDGTAHHIAAVKFITGGEWKIYDDATLAGLQSVDGDGGFIAMYSNIATEQSMLQTGKIDLGDAERPVLTFYTYNIVARDPDTGEIVGAIDRNGLSVLVNDRTAGFVAVRDMTMDKLPAEGWNRIVVDLSAYRGKVIELGFTATTENKQYTLLDDIRVFDQLDNNLTLASISGAPKVQPNTRFDVIVTIENNGAMPSQAYTIDLKHNETIVESINGPQLGSGQRATVSFAQTLNVTQPDNHIYEAILNYDIDELPSDNVNTMASLLLMHSKMPIPTGLTANTAKGSVDLAWNEPDLNVVVADEVTEDFESYESFAKENVGGWTFVDNDGLPIGNMNSIGMPGIVEDTKLSWFVNDASFEGWKGSIKGHSGNKFLATVYTKGGANDDWIISPRLAPTAQKISFYARSYNAKYPEAMQMLYSTTSSELNSFVRVKEIPNVSTDWKQYSFDIPEDAQYFAIRCVSDDCAMLFVDDITYAPYREAVVKVDGYNIYRDGVRINDLAVELTSYIDSPADAPRRFCYAVSALYDQTESRASVPVEIDVESGLGTIATEGAIITSGEGYISISGIKNKYIEIVDLSGRCMHRARVDDITRIEIAPGVYLVRVNQQVIKVLVR